MRQGPSSGEAGCYRDSSMWAQIVPSSLTSPVTLGRRLSPADCLFLSWKMRMTTEDSEGDAGGLHEVTWARSLGWFLDPGRPLYEDQQLTLFSPYVNQVSTP